MPNRSVISSVQALYIGEVDLQLDHCRASTPIMPFPFFDLPPEVRNMIYILLFVTTDKDKIVIPDPARTRRDNGLGAQLRTCQMVHDERKSHTLRDSCFSF